MRERDFSKGALRVAAAALFAGAALLPTVGSAQDYHGQEYFDPGIYLYCPRFVAQVVFPEEWGHCYDPAARPSAYVAPPHKKHKKKHKKGWQDGFPPVTWHPPKPHGKIHDPMRAAERELPKAVISHGSSAANSLKNGVDATADAISGGSRSALGAVSAATSNLTSAPSSGSGSSHGSVHDTVSSTLGSISSALNK